MIILDDLIIIVTSVDLVSALGIMLSTPVSVTGPVSSLAFWTAILGDLALKAYHQFLTFVVLVATQTHAHF